MKITEKQMSRFGDLASGKPAAKPAAPAAPAPPAAAGLRRADPGSRTGQS